MRGFFHVITILGAVAASLTVLWTIGSDISAVQESAGVAYALSFVIIPYCFARTFEQLAGNS
jgi:hypothetical protein